MRVPAAFPALPVRRPLTLSMPRPRRRPPATTALPLELAFWALWHCRHARPPDTLPR
ncbi:hypothetical protein [Zestomonas thermotolerans]|uniref:hypothetical protein n=1 Tax=Zestomonas thermotolerans TaxID=157784 RepID=UPI0018CBF55A|nr:hypothetical protein [Pseudomonas thermotolerans]